ncbi:hypothetical protein VPH35_107539 [Triticum aestivum]
MHVTDFDDAVRQVLHLLHDSDGTAQGKIKAFFFRGWRGEGLGASAVLRAVAQRLKSTRTDSDMRKHFGKIIHVDCSLWKNRRTMQRAIAEELNLHNLMHVFDERDKEDDFRGVDDSSRAVIDSIRSVINRSLKNERFTMIFHYGGDEDIDLAEFGVPIFGEGKLLWTIHGRFQFPRKKLKVMSSSVDIHMYFEGDEYIWKSQVHALLPKEAAQVIGYTGMDEISPSIYVDCFLYSLFLTEQLRGNSISVDYGWATHACNYWICDGILDGNRAWEVGNALYGVIPPLGHFSVETEILACSLDRNIKPYQGWNSITLNKQAEQNISTVPVNASSYFLTFAGDGRPKELQNDLFQLASDLRVLKPCKCSFDFSSPPFRCCQKLRFLWLDNCTNTGKEKGEGACFPDLLVLDLRSTNYVLSPQMIELMTNLRELNTKGVSWRTLCRHFWKKLQNLQKLRLTESSDLITLDNCSAVDMMNLELLDFSGNTHMESLPEMSSARSLKVLVLDGCSSLKDVALERAHPLLESFSFDGYGPAANWTQAIQLPRKELRPKSRVDRIEEAKVTKISLEGCTRLHSIFLHALFNLKELDVSGTAIKTIDLGAMDVPQLKKLFLQGCEQLCRLFWDGRNLRLDVLYVDTNQGKTGSGVCCGEQRYVHFEACICCRDGRFIWSPVKALYEPTFGYSSKVHLHISSTIHSQVNITKSIEEIPPSQEDLVPTRPLLPYSGTILARDLTRLSLVWDHQQLHPLGCHIEIGEGSHDLETVLMYSGSFSYIVRSMHVHDNSSVTAIPQTPAKWYHIQ